MSDVAVFNPTPSTERNVTVDVARTVPRRADAVGVAVGTEGAVPARSASTGRRSKAAGFEGKLGQTLALPRRDGPTVVAVGVGGPGELDAARLRDAAAAFARAAGKQAHLATALADLDGVDAVAAGQAVVEGVLLAGYRYGALKKDAPSSDLDALTLVAAADRSAGVDTGARRGVVTAAAAQLARDLANTPPGHLTASRMADVAIAVGASSRPRRRGVRRGCPGRRSAAAACSASTPAARSHRAWSSSRTGRATRRGTSCSSARA